MCFQAAALAQFLARGATLGDPNNFPLQSVLDATAPGGGVHGMWAYLEVRKRLGAREKKRLTKAGNKPARGTGMYLDTHGNLAKIDVFFKEETKVRNARLAEDPPGVDPHAGRRASSSYSFFRLYRQIYNLRQAAPEELEPHETLFLQRLDPLHPECINSWPEVRAGLRAPREEEEQQEEEEEEQEEEGLGGGAAQQVLALQEEVRQLQEQLQEAPQQALQLLREELQQHEEPEESDEESDEDESEEGLFDTDSEEEDTGDINVYKTAMVKMAAYIDEAVGPDHSAVNLAEVMRITKAEGAVIDTAFFNKDSANRYIYEFEVEAAMVAREGGKSVVDIHKAVVAARKRKPGPVTTPANKVARKDAGPSSAGTDVARHAGQDILAEELTAQG